MFTRVSEPVRFHMPWSRSLAPVIPKIDHVDRDPLMIFWFRYTLEIKKFGMPKAI